jgi:hypothetical protein
MNFPPVFNNKNNPAQPRTGLFLPVPPGTGLPQGLACPTAHSPSNPPHRRSAKNPQAQAAYLYVLFSTSFLHCAPKQSPTTSSRMFADILCFGAQFSVSVSSSTKHTPGSRQGYHGDFSLEKPQTPGGLTSDPTTWRFHLTPQLGVRGSSRFPFLWCPHHLTVVAVSGWRCFALRPGEGFQGLLRKLPTTL